MTVDTDPRRPLRRPVLRQRRPVLAGGRRLLRPARLRPPPGRRPRARRRGRPGGPPARRRPPAEPPSVRRYGLAAMAFTLLGALTHAGVLLFRGLATDRLPWGNMYEFATAVVLVAVVAFAVLAVRRPALRHLGVFVLAPVVLAMVAIGLFLYAEAGPLVAALRSSWLAVHVTTAILGFGIFFVSGIASVMYLLRLRHDARVAAGTADRGRRCWTGCPPRPRSTGWRTAPPSSASRSGPSPSSPAPSGPRAPGAASGAGTPRRPGPSSPGSSTPPTCTPARRPAGAAGPAAWVNVVGLGVMVFNLLYVNMVSTGPAQLRRRRLSGPPRPAGGHRDVQVVTPGDRTPVGGRRRVTGARVRAGMQSWTARGADHGG